MPQFNRPAPEIAAPLPDSAGVGLKPEHIDYILAERPDIGFLEIHAENYMGDGGPPHRRLEAIRAHYPISLHGVGLSIGGPDPLDPLHLKRLREIADRYQPGSFSEHLAWSSHGENFFNDLLPLPYTQETLATVCDHVDEVQSALGRRMLLENPSTYIRFTESVIPETEFLREITRRTGCGLLLDVANVLVSSINHDFDADAYLAEFPIEAVGEIHLAGAADAIDDTGHTFLIDAHDSPVRAATWRLFRAVVARRGAVPTLVEWDNDVPDFPTLHTEARRAEAVLRPARKPAAELRRAI